MTSLRKAESRQPLGQKTRDNPLESKRLNAGLDGPWCSRGRHGPLVKLFGSKAEGTISTGSSHMNCGGVRDPQVEGKPQELYWGIQLASSHSL